MSTNSQFGNLAQLVEPRTVNPREKSVRVRKRGVTLSAGSNPAVPIRQIYCTFTLSVYDDILCRVHSKAVTTSVALFTTLGTFVVYLVIDFQFALTIKVLNDIAYSLREMGRIYQ